MILMFYLATRFEDANSFGNTFCFTKSVYVSRTKSISKLASVRRIIAKTLLKKTKSSGSSIKYRTLARRKSILFLKNVVNFGEKSLLSKISVLYIRELNSDYSFSTNKNYFYNYIIGNPIIFLGKKLKTFSMVSRYFNFSVAKKYYTFFFKISRNSVRKSVWVSLIEHFLSSLSYIRYVNDYNKLAGLEFVIDPSSSRTMEDIMYAGTETSSESESADRETDSETDSDARGMPRRNMPKLDLPLSEEASSSEEIEVKSVRVMNLELRSDFFFNKAVKSMVLGSDNIPTKSSNFFGINLWNYTRLGVSKPRASDISNVLYAFLGKFLFRSYERSINAVGLLIGRTNNFGFFYKNSKDFLNQSWGNSGEDIRFDLIRNEIYFNYTHRNFVNNKDVADMDLYNIYSESLFRVCKSSKYSENIKYSESGSSLEEVKISPIFMNWAKAGYVIINDHNHLESRINHVGDTFKNFNINFDSKVFGHPFHLVNPSILPITFSFVFFTLIQDILSSFCLEMWYVNSFSVLSHAAMLGLFFSVILSWLFEIYSEEQAGCHTLEVQGGFKYAILLFILSELMLFVSFFWAYFHFSLNSNSFTGGTYAPRGVIPFYATRIPYLNTLLLLSSGLSLTIAHTLIVESDKLAKIVVWVEVLSSKTISDWFAYWDGIVGGMATSLNYPNELEYFAVFSEFFLREQTN